MGGGAPVRFDGRVPAYARVLLVLLVWGVCILALATLKFRKKLD